MKKFTLSAVVLCVSAGAHAQVVNSSNAMFDISTLSGFGTATSAVFNMSGTGWAGWSVPSGKVALGAVITASSPLSVSAPALPGTAYPHYTFGANEYGWVVQNGGTAQQVQIDVFYADAPEGYAITKSSQLNFSGTGFGGWSAPNGHVVTGGGYEFFNSTPQLSTIGTPGSVWPHYTFGAEEAGWVVQNGGTQSGGHVYVISFVPAPGALALLGMGGLVAARRRRA
ncbi:MAG: PEP-CTERM sorting domain-containing protein [Phycisphaeraceae bacterium]|nr:PEP-CTERM sorting domain-containing protein [Phycisphaeraceae bacterium]